MSKVLARSWPGCRPSGEAVFFAMRIGRIFYGNGLRFPQFQGTMCAMGDTTQPSPLAKRLETGIEEIDAQHRYLFATLILLEKAIREGNGKAQVATTIGNLEKYANRHFADEEALFDRVQYPDAASHRAIHVEFMKYVGRLKETKNWDDTDLIALSRSLDVWLTEHILKVDMTYVAFIKADGGKRGEGPG